MKKIISFLMILTVAILSVSFFGSCEKEEAPLGDIELPPAPMIAADESWAVIDTAYLRLRERPAAGAGIVTTLWRGYVLEVMSRSPSRSMVDGREDYWYQVNYDGLQGWVFGSYLSIYDTREEASVRSRAVRND